MPEKEQSQKDELDFLWKVHEYTNDYIRFADQKAGAVLAVQIGLVAALYSSKIHASLSFAKFRFPATVYDTTLGVASCLAFVGLLLGIAFAIVAISPRLFSDFRPSLIAKLRSRLLDDRQKGYIFWKQVLNYSDRESYLDGCKALNDEIRIKAISHHIYVLAGIANAKFDWIVLSVFAGVFGSVFAVIALVLQTNEDFL